MILKSHLEKILEENRSFVLEKYLLTRNLDIPDKSKSIIVISGIRRSGKSTLLKQRFATKKTSLFINFEDPRLVHFDMSDIEKLAGIMAEKGTSWLLIDEIQNLKSWEKLARFFHDRHIKLVITGSNSSLLSKELGSKLTGRYRQFELFPFSFEEYVDYLKLEKNAENFKKYLYYGGFPEYLNEKSDDYLHTLLNNIVIRDVAVRRNIRNEDLLLRLTVFLYSNVGKIFSYNKLSTHLEIKSVRTTIDYCDYLEDSYLLEFLPQFSWSPKKQLVRPKKVYGIDTGIVRANSLSHQEDWGRYLENAVFLKLRQKQYELYYWKSATSECDFIVKNQNKIKFAIQVCWELTPDNMQRELNGINDAIKETGAETGIIITLDQEDDLNGIHVIPVWNAETLL
ncbi:MAG: ATP-binding protein [Bacteroidales bacterium]